MLLVSYMNWATTIRRLPLLKSIMSPPPIFFFRSVIRNSRSSRSSGKLDVVLLAWKLAQELRVLLLALPLVLFKGSVTGTNPAAGSHSIATVDALVVVFT